MNMNLLIVGAGTYAVVAAEIAANMGCFHQIDFVDDVRKTTPDGRPVVGTTEDLPALAERYSNIAVAIGNPRVRLALLGKIRESMPYKIVSLISPQAYIAPSAQLKSGCIVEPMAVVQSLCVIGEGCILSAGAVVNHAAVCAEGVHVDCNATIPGYAQVSAGVKVNCGQVFEGGSNNV